ncbi:hypothetical protein Tco_0820003 [Tanacetum coccineum]|uniref:Halobacterial output domain-containing protein n=1 Tax=Tanacetum coccineum TaxID=301880 RepID=A0ABQ5A9X3_9ASTR
MYAQLYFFDTQNENRNWMAAFVDKKTSEVVDERILLSESTKTRQYDAPTVSEVAALITNDFGDGIPTRDIMEHSYSDAEDEGIFDSGCSISMTGNMERLDVFQEFQGGKVTVVESKGRI